MSWQKTYSINLSSNYGHLYYVNMAVLFILFVQSKYPFPDDFYICIPLKIHSSQEWAMYEFITFKYYHVSILGVI